MVISDKITDLIQYRIQQEEQSAHFYKAMAVWLEFSGYSGAAKLWNVYSEEEKVHAQKARQYLLDLNILPITPALTLPDSTYKGLPHVIARSFEHELIITDQCKALAVRARLEEDYMTLALAQWYLTEQAEELGKIQYWVDRLNLFGTDKVALLMLDKEMGGQ
jgi:ferritin